jgi:tetraacyldisaccharide 4'-kinase
VKSYRSALLPLSVPYEIFARLRAWTYRKGIVPTRRLPGVVISVGNLTLGGTGKTPFVIWLAGNLLDRGKHVAVLTRGYRGQFRGILRSHWKDEIKKSPELSPALSDETRIMESELAKHPEAESLFAIGVGPDRFTTGSELTKAGFDWFVLDDGFQHLSLARDLNILLIDATNPFGGGHVLPAGGLREPRSALKRADIAVITRSKHAPAIETIVRRYSPSPIHYATLNFRGLTTLISYHHGGSYTPTPRTKFFAFGAIGNPAAFFTNLRDWKLPIVGHAAFPDHHKYTPGDIEHLEAQARAAGADALVCTKKDAMNLQGVVIRTFPVWVCNVSLEIHDPAGFWRDAAEILKVKRPEISL